MRKLSLALLAVSPLLAEPPKDAGALFQTSKVWTVHLTFTAEQWAALEPKGGPQGFPGGPGRGGPGGPGGPPGGPGGFGPAGMIAPAFLAGDSNKDQQLSQEEFRALGEEWFKSWDTKKTGALGADELRAGMMQLFQAGMNRMMRPGGGGGPIIIGGPGGRGPGAGFTAAAGKRNGLSGASGIDFEFVHANVDFDGAALTDVAVRYKGNGTFMQSRGQDKKSFKLDLNKFHKGQKLAGLGKLNLHNNVTDASWMNEVLSYRLYRDAKVPAPRTAYARVYVTVAGQHERKYLGLYSVVEDIDNTFAQERFATKDGAILKPATAPFEYLGAEWSAYAQPYDAKNDITAAQQKRVIDFARLVSQANDEEFRAKLADYLDLEEFARFMAVTTWLSTLDSILGMGQNYYAYLNAKTNRFEFLPWDLDHSFGQFGMGASQEQREQLSILEPWAGNVKLLQRVYADPRFRKLYLERMAEFDKTIFQPARLIAQVDELAKALRPAVKDESASKLARFDKVVAGEAVAPEMGGFGPPPGGGGGFGPPPGGGGFGGGFGQVKPIKTFVTARAQSVHAQLTGEAKGMVRTMGFGPGGPGRGPGGPPGFERSLLDAFDTDKNGSVTHEEFRAGFARWFANWDTNKSGSLTETQLREGINKDLNPFRGGFPRGG